MLQVTNSRKKSDDFIIAGLLCCIVLSWNHNHDTATAEALSYRSSLKSTFVAYFSEGLTPSVAMKYHKDCIEMAADFVEQHLADASTLYTLGIISGGCTVWVCHQFMHLF